MFRRSTVTNTTKETTCYSDFPMPAEFPNYLHHSKLLEYLRMYADHFQLEQYIRYEREVVSVEQELDGGGRWSVTTRKRTGSSETATEIFDAVMVCTGIFSKSNMPSFEGQDEFKGELIHSVSYRQAPSYSDCLIGDDASATVNMQTFFNFNFNFYNFEWCSLLCVVRMGTSIDGRKSFWLPANFITS